MKVLVIPVEGDIEVREINGSLASMQEIVGGYIECVGLRDDLDAWCNEDGIAEGLPLNLRATALLETAFDMGVHLFGPVFFTGGIDDEGDSLPIDDSDVMHLTGLANALSHLL